MINLSQNQLLELWSDFEQAYYGDHPYGGDTAEIYAYRLLQYDPTQSRPWRDEQRIQATNSLRAVLDLFCKKRSCRATIDGVPRTKWKSRFDHRCHVKIVH